MIYLYHGTDTDKAREKVHSLIDSLRKKKPDASFFKMDNDHFDGEMISEYSLGQGLFSNKYIVFLNKICDIKDQRESFLEKLDEMKSSDNIFIILEGKLDKATLSKIEKKAEKVVSFDSVEKLAKKEDFNIFSLGDALGRRDKKNLWVLYRMAIENGKSGEEIHGTLFWQMKSIVIANKSKDITSSGLSPFVFSKAKSYAGNFNEEELQKIVGSLVSVTHEVRRGNGEMETSLERWILEAI